MIVNIRDFLDKWELYRLVTSGLVKEGYKIQVNQDLLEFKNNEWHLVGSVQLPTFDKVILDEH